MALSFGERPIGLKSIRVASYNILTGTIGTSVEVPEAKKLSLTPVGGNDKAEANLLVTAAASWIKQYEGEFEWNGIPFDVMAVLMGSSFITAAVSGSTPNQVQTASLSGGYLMPYFCLAGVSLAHGGTANLVQAYKICMLEEPPTFGMMEDGKWSISSAKLGCYADSNQKFGIMRRLEAGLTFDDTAFQALFA